MGCFYLFPSYALPYRLKIQFQVTDGIFSMLGFSLVGHCAFPLAQNSSRGLKSASCVMLVLELDCGFFMAYVFIECVGSRCAESPWEGPPCVCQGWVGPPTSEAPGCFYTRGFLIPRPRPRLWSSGTTNLHTKIFMLQIIYCHVSIHSRGENRRAMPLFVKL